MCLFVLFHVGDVRFDLVTASDTTDVTKSSTRASFEKIDAGPRVLEDLNVQDKKKWFQSNIICVH